MLKKILYSVFGAILALATLIFLSSFFLYLLSPKPDPILDQNPMPAAGLVFMWIAILGAGVGAFFLLRAAVRAFRGDAAGEEEELKGDYDEDGVDGYDV